MIAIVGTLAFLLFVVLLLYLDHRRDAKRKHAH